MTPPRNRRNEPGLVVLFGSGEMSPTGRKIHEAVFKRLGFSQQVAIGILETPTGFEVNAIHGWPERMEDFFRKSLANYKPRITRVRAWRRDRHPSTNDPEVVDVLLEQSYIYCGAGSPGYTVRHLSGTRAYRNLVTAHKNGATLCLGSASVVAIGHYILPVYEIFKAGADLHWDPGLSFFGSSKFPLVFIPHWNNKEGEDFDTRRSWMGVERYEKLAAMLPEDSVIIGIDEQTACIFDPVSLDWEVAGIGSAHVCRSGKEEEITSGGKFRLDGI